MRSTEFATFVNGIRDNYEIDKKLYGVDAAIALVDDPDKKQSINPKDVAIPESEFKLQSLKPIVLSGIRDVNLIETSDCVFKVGRTTGLTKGQRSRENSIPIYTILVKVSNKRRVGVKPYFGSQE
ncbi:hypothetical protein GLOIN_2v1782266 [Rhizophagus irregularis DAOM 181602=DAOM 197198]|uniref:Uncharacterized protein n=1 Tax=Rhizophagus irregularis (strain DAOM 181602 / DAOM 197198 / MUCL 43194) TaxID=747089 RepID=A0A2P4PHY2_RHIID|nr:hypothetical protein GLOIN_2v1782266 [Rhizophagus irregularis DAOM 181602=DAOM 197198]POG64988.1 hypothetical protein GLOIN_2v1782266 [Rhizophagus irregularis DAOM 181602=DAOM 197198]|eukprot:XP_025171854.1 hypothetical protein GLOIN_2v1782266 [Rhizophagus irregularis DAOM 181602=DAOM 197198]